MDDAAGRSQVHHPDGPGVVVTPHRQDGHMRTTLPFPTRRHPAGRAGQATSRYNRRPTHRLDARTRELGLAGVASARLVLAACRSRAVGIPGRIDPDPTGAVTPLGGDRQTGNDDQTGSLPMGGVDRALPEAA